MRLTEPHDAPGLPQFSTIYDSIFMTPPALKVLSRLFPLLVAIAACPAVTATASEPSSVPSITVHDTRSDLPSQLRQVATTGQMTLRVREGNLLQLPRAVTKVLIADPKIASFQVPSPTSLFVFAEQAGNTTLYALDAKDAVVAAVRIVAEYNLGPLREQITRSVPNARIELEPALNNHIVVRGTVRTPIEAKQVVDQVQAYLDANSSSGGSKSSGSGASSTTKNASGGGSSFRSSTSTTTSGGGGVVNQLKVELSSQINIQVRVVEVSRSLSHELGFDWSATLSTGSGSFGFGSGNAAALFDATSMSSLLPSSSTSGATLGGFATRGRFSLGGLISALSSEGMATLLAEPNLTAMSGESAAFAAGGEVPVVIITNNNTTIDYKSYGVILRMTPTLLSPNRISLHIAPEVSELTDEGSVTLSGATIPALKVRRADTTVELASGQSFALAGMLRSNSSQTISGVPGLSSIPWIGRLFEHETTESEETELVILVTANVVDPVAAADLQIPGRGLSVIDSLVPSEAAAGYLY